MSHRPEEWHKQPCDIGRPVMKIFIIIGKVYEVVQVIAFRIKRKHFTSVDALKHKSLAVVRR